MKLTVSQKIVLGLVVILVLCLLILWAALRKPVEHNKVFAVSSLVPTCEFASN
jgi:CHASE3 domain sensor protein